MVMPHLGTSSTDLRFRACLRLVPHFLTSIAFWRAIPRFEDLGVGISIIGFGQQPAQVAQHNEELQLQQKRGKCHASIISLAEYLFTCIVVP